MDLNLFFENEKYFYILGRLSFCAYRSFTNANCPLDHLASDDREANFKTITALTDTELESLYETCRACNREQGDI